MEDFLDDQDEEEELRDQIKIPSDLEDADEEDDYGGEFGQDNEEGEQEIDEDEEFNQFGNDAAGDHENEVFALAKENNEMADPFSLNQKDKPTSYANQEMVDRIEKLEK